MRTLLTLDMLSSLNLFQDVFDIDEYRRTRLDSFVYLVQEKDLIMLSEVYQHFLRTEPLLVQQAEEHFSETHPVTGKFGIRSLLPKACFATENPCAFAKILAISWVRNYKGFQIERNPELTFFKATPQLARALSERHYETPTPVQAAVLRPDAENRDILVSAQTGSGKTVAFGLAMSSDLMGAGEMMPQTESPLGASSSRRRVNWRCKSRPNCNGSTNIPARASPPASAAWTSAASAAPSSRARKSSSARRDACATISSGTASTPRASPPWCSTRPTKCSTWAFAKTSNSSSTPRRKTAAP